ncbi:MAG: hypothetical protein U0572_00085 [Phycisphaerales bacterium]
MTTAPTTLYAQVWPLFEELATKHAAIEERRALRLPANPPTPEMVVQTAVKQVADHTARVASDERFGLIMQSTDLKRHLEIFASRFLVLSQLDRPEDLDQIERLRAERWGARADANLIAEIKKIVEAVENGDTRARDVVAIYGAMLAFIAHAKKAGNPDQMHETLRKRIWAVTQTEVPDPYSATRPQGASGPTSTPEVYDVDRSDHTPRVVPPWLVITTALLLIATACFGVYWAKTEYKTLKKAVLEEAVIPPAGK